MQYILTVILYFYPGAWRHRKIAPLYIVTDFQLVRLDVRYDAENFFPTDYTFPKTARSNRSRCQFHLTIGEAKWKYTVTTVKPACPT